MSARARPPAGGPGGLLPGLVLAVLLAAGCTAPPPEVAELTGRTMGTSYSVKLAPAPPPEQRAALQQGIEALLDQVNRQMSTYIADSDLMRFNRSQSVDWQPVPDGLVELAERARLVSEATDGAYDVTVGPLVNLWGFGNAGRRDAPPPAAEIEETLARVGYRLLEARAVPSALRKAVPGLEVDLSSIAKGWAVDRIGMLLEAEGLGDYLVEIGGDLRARGSKAPGRPWRVAIERPDDERRTVHRVLELRDAALATSGDYRNFFEDGGRRFNHTIDPRSGQAVQHRLASVSVVAADCTDADAWATALMALGDIEGPALAERLGLAALFIVRAEQGLEAHHTAAMAALLNTGPTGVQ
jgi:thiamine biosynthesis lipoprotein